MSRLMSYSGYLLYSGDSIIPDRPFPLDPSSCFSVVVAFLPSLVSLSVAPSLVVPTFVVDLLVVSKYGVVTLSGVVS